MLRRYNTCASGSSANTYPYGMTYSTTTCSDYGYYLREQASAKATGGLEGTGRARSADLRGAQRACSD
jgi:hypothetical protein